MERLARASSNHGDGNKTNNTTIPEWYFESVALWHKNGRMNGQSKRAANADYPETRWEECTAACQKKDVVANLL
jgi:hypothetical protein